MTEMTTTAQSPNAQSDVRRLRNYAGGRWIDAEAPESLDDRDPATGELLARIPLSGAADVDAVVTAASEAASRWRAVPVLARARVLQRIRQVLDDHTDELAALVTQDMGKTLPDARAEVRRGIESVEAATAAATLMKGENLEGVATGVDVEMVRQPVGVVAAICPFNFPAMIPLWFLPFALGTGNAFILKPSERTPLPAERIVELLAGIQELPPGIVNLVHGGREAVDRLLRHPRVGAISFVGQSRTARTIATVATEHGTRVQALGGAKNALVIMPDAPPATVSSVLSSSFGAAGQRCLAGSVAVLVGTREEQDAQRDALVAAAAALRVGPGDDPSTDVCPLVAPEARTRIVSAVEAAEGRGATVVLDGRGGGGVAGTVLGPTIVEVADRDDPLAREELFGPVLALVRARDLDEAIGFVNGSSYGNAAMLFTCSGGTAREFRFRVEAGMVGVNIGVAAPIAWFPFAGWKDSFVGSLHANGTDAVEFYTRKKVVTSRWPTAERSEA